MTNKIDNPNDFMVNQMELATILGVPQPVVVKFVRQGLPRITGTTQKNTLYHIPSCVKWYVDHITTISDNKDALKQAQIRKLNLESDRIDIELAEKRKELIEVIKISNIWGHLLSEIKTNLLVIPKKIASVFDSITESYELEELLTESLHDCLESLSRAEFLVDNELTK